VVDILHAQLITILPGFSLFLHLTGLQQTKPRIGQTIWS